MTLPLESGLTPVRVRGKRRGISAEKWHHGKRRKPELQKRRTEVISTSSSQNLPGRPRKRRRRDSATLSPLERLPAEVLHAIFKYSANVNLPLVSRELAFKLSKSAHLRQQLTTALLSPVLHTGPGGDATAAQLAAATRLLNSKFVTWSFFTLWLKGHAAATLPATVLAKIAQGEAEWRALWSALGPAHSLLPPKKLLSPPFTQEKTAFLTVLTQETRDVAAIDPAYSELAYDGLEAAIRHGEAQVVSLMLTMGLSGTTDLLRLAVTDSGCDVDIVQMLLQRPNRSEQASSSQSESRSPDDVDFLDPILWSWAERARKNGNDRGEWLLQVLRDAQQQNPRLATCQ